MFDPLDLLLAVLLCVVVHEAGHAVAAYLLGWRVARVRLMWYGPALELRVANLTNRKIPSDVRWMAAAGPLANFLLALVAAPFSPPLAFVSLVCGVGNLIPIRPADGWAILHGRAKRA